MLEVHYHKQRSKETPMGDDLPQVIQLDEFQKKALETHDNSRRPRDQFLASVLSLNAISGDVSNLVGNGFFGEIEIPTDILAATLGDALYEIAVLSKLLGLDLSEVATLTVRARDVATRRTEIHVDADVEVEAG